MLLLRAFKVALSALAANTLRSALAVLGIVIGVSAVIMTVSMGLGAQAKTEDFLDRMGVNLLFVYPGNTSRGAGGARSQTAETLTLEDADALARLPHVTAMAPDVRRPFQVKYFNRNETAMVVGTTPAHLEIRRMAVDRGAYLDAPSVSGRRRVCVLGSEIARRLFGDVDPVGRTIQIDRKAFDVVGVLAPKGADMGMDTWVHVPVTTALYRLFNRRHLSNITLSVDAEGNIERTIDAVDAELMKLHRIQDPMDADFVVRSMQEWRRQALAAAAAFTQLLMSVAGISLLVGGIGIMNIMLVSVTERTREIGIRKAVGARRRDILKQFLIESTAISLMGGLLGVALGIAGTQVLPRLPIWKSMSSGSGAWESVLSLSSILVAFAFSCAVGLFFGLYPALKAARLAPVEALRYD